MATLRPWRTIILEPAAAANPCSRASPRIGLAVMQPATEKTMKLYSSFLIRWWLTRAGSASERTVLHVEHIQTGAATRAASLTEAEKWMRETCCRAASAAEE